MGGVPLDDETLKKTFGETGVTPIILGGIQASENVNAFLKLPLKSRPTQELKRRNLRLRQRPDLKEVDGDSGREKPIQVKPFKKKEPELSKKKTSELLFKVTESGLVT